MLIASYCKTILLTSTDTEVQKNVKSGIEMLYNSYTAYIQRFKLYYIAVWAINIGLVKEGQGLLSFKQLTIAN